VLAAVVSGSVLLTTVPAGALTDRISRTRLLGVTIVLTSAGDDQPTAPPSPTA